MHNLQILHVEVFVGEMGEVGGDGQTFPGGRLSLTRSLSAREIESIIISNKW